MPQSKEKKKSEQIEYWKRRGRGDSNEWEWWKKGGKKDEEVDIKEM